MFRDSLKKMIDRLDPSSDAAGVLMGFDGIPVDSYVRPGAADAPTISVELTHLIAQLRRSLASIGTGQLSDLTLKTDRLAVLVEILSDGYFLALALAPGANLGKARYLLRTVAPEVRAQM
ncbi:MAG TPA: hypothetical protein VGP07_14385 [Polyangia bacterium]|jgi:predicted regulator of Ras-like GTPase activity (Roadblock/LC7/MglB family)